jgi:hypothetical protein
VFMLFIGSVVIVANVSAIVSKESKGAVLSIKHLAKHFYFCFIFSFIKPNQKDLTDLVISSKL